MHTASFPVSTEAAKPGFGGLRALEVTAWVVLVLLLAGWDEGATSVFLAILVPMHLVATHLLLDCSPEVLRPRLWTLARVMLLLPVFFAGS
ncbi:MAG: hypothetical protein KatS3mg109_1458 [Pirellulaceae bacterium]|nr:MAG: hypothetical protein KatS3mg109_1458 [Pirellulaceae bacterium]